MSKNIKPFDARIVQTIRSLKFSNKSNNLSNTQVNKLNTINKPLTSSKALRNSMGNKMINYTNKVHPNTAHQKISIEASNIESNPYYLNQLKELKKQCFIKYKNLCVFLILNDKEVQSIWKKYYNNNEIIYIENWLIKNLFQKNFFIFKLDDLSKVYEDNIENGANKSLINDNDNKNSEQSENESELKKMIKNEIIKIIEDINIDNNIEKKLKDINEDYKEYISALNNFSYK